MGNSTINVSKDENLTCLLDSFHIDRPKGRRGIPSWNLSLVLHQLTKAPFEPLKEAKWAIFTKWCLSNQVDFRAPPLKAIAAFLLYLCQDRKLQLGTIDGYRSAIADKLGIFPINVSKDENLTRLLDSFHRDRPKGRRDIPSWNLSLVLHQLTKAPFEPMKEASLKHLTFKNVFCWPWVLVNAGDPCLAS